MDKKTQKRKHRKGVLVVLFALLIPILIVILGFTIDYANMQRVRNEARMVSDLAAKAAADTLARTGGDESAALQAAIDVAASNTIAGEPHDLQTSDVIFGQAIEQADGSFQFTNGNTPYNSVRVSARRTGDSIDGRVPLFFGLFYGQPAFDLEQSATASFREVEVCLVLDRSGSMKWKTVGSMTQTEIEEVRCKTPSQQSRWNALDGAIDKFLTEFESTPAQERVAMVTFASDETIDCDGSTVHASTLDQALTSDLSQIRSAMEDYSNSIWYGATNITAGIRSARIHMESAGSNSRKRYIIAFTDGQYNQGGAPFAEATACAAAGITLHTITFSDGANTADMIATATNGGGQHYHADGEAELQAIFRRLASSFAILTD